jgi:Uma2 family endonuclease
MSIATPAPSMPATLDDLHKVEGKAELIGGRIVRFMPSGFAPGQAALKITLSLHAHSNASGRGVAIGDGVGFSIRPPLTSGRQSFCPDAAYHTGYLPKNRMRFIEGAPDFAVEVRSEGDYGRGAEAEMAAKRTDYFEAGTKVVWDVDPDAKEIRCYRADSAQTPIVWKTGNVADAEPAVAGWKMAVDEVFD